MQVPGWQDVLTRNPHREFSMYRPVLLLILMLALAGCLSAPPPEQPARPAVPLPTTIPPVQTTAPETPVPVPTTAPTKVTTTIRTPTPVPTPTLLSEAALNARIVDARNRLNNLIESDMADTIVYEPQEGCSVKQSRELGYLIDATTGESTFVKGDYGSISADLFTAPMDKDHEYVIIHTHPRMWATCRGSGIVSLYTFSIGDLEATAALTDRGYRIKYLIALSDKEYRIWPKVEGDWKSPAEIRQAIRRIENRYEMPFTYYDTVLGKEYFAVDSLMPLLAKELGYSYTANGVVMA